MTENQGKQLADYVQVLGDGLGLRDWLITYLDEPVECPNHGAEISVIFGRKCAQLKLCADFWQKDAETQRHYLALELIHLHFSGATEVLRCDIWNSGALSKNLYDMLDESFSRQVEYCVDGLAAAVAKFYPLPEFDREQVAQ
jgi:hypothetical protein